MVVHDCNPSTWEVEAGGWRVPGHPGPLSEILSKKQKQKKDKEMILIPLSSERSSCAFVLLSREQGPTFPPLHVP
jgi:hypothetical protein